MGALVGLDLEGPSPQRHEPQHPDPDYGPATYLPAQPYTNKLLADLEEICDWQAEQVRAWLRL